MTREQKIANEDMLSAGYYAGSVFRKSGALIAGLFCWFSVSLFSTALADQTITLIGDAGGKRFDGIGAVSGGGATSVLLKDYPEPQRSQILDLLFRPKFGASMSALLVEVPGDGNSTQGSEPSHMHERDDLNYSRGYEWWLMREAKKRNPALTLDACAWGCPGWVGNGDFWSQDMCDYYVQWIQGLKKVYGLELTAIGCRNERGVNEDFAKRFRATLNAHSLEKVKLHGFDNWDTNKFAWAMDLKTDPDLRKAVDILSNHTMADIPTPMTVQKLAETLNKPIWNSEEHVYKAGFDCEISLVKSFNENFIQSGVTKIVNWYLVASVYPLEPYSEEPAALIANSPWSGQYHTREVLWGYGGCGNLAGGGTLITLKSPGKDYSVILETKDAAAVQTINFKVGGGLSDGDLCVWRSDATAQFVQLAGIKPRNGCFTLALEPNAIYSISTTRGQQKGDFADVPAAKAFPFPYYENFDEYARPEQWGYLPHYTADIAGVFEIANRPDGPGKNGVGKCLRQVVGEQPQSWAPEWMPYTILGDEHWRDYEVSADIYLENNGWAGVMGRINNVGSGYGSTPKGYYLRLAATGECALYAVTQAKGETDGELLARGIAPGVASRQWHNLKLQFYAETITGFVDDTQILSVTNNLYSQGMAGLVTEGGKTRSTACFGKLMINPIGAVVTEPTRFSRHQLPIYH